MSVCLHHRVTDSPTTHGFGSGACNYPVCAWDRRPRRRLRRDTSHDRAAAGARLLAGGASIPGYGDTGGAEPSEADQLLALWSVLYTDPWYELRLLRNLSLIHI